MSSNSSNQNSMVESAEPYMELAQPDFVVEPEDSNLSRSFNSCYNVSTLLEKFYNLGKEGKEVTFEYKDMNEEL